MVTALSLITRRLFRAPRPEPLTWSASHATAPRLEAPALFRPLGVLSTASPLGPDEPRALRVLSSEPFRRGEVFELEVCDGCARGPRAVRVAGARALSVAEGPVFEVALDVLAAI